MTASTPTLAELIKIPGKDHLHIGGKEVREGWKLLNIQGGATMTWYGVIFALI